MYLHSHTDTDQRVEVALRDGNSKSEGRVEVSKNGQTGTICDDLFDDNDATVICRMLNYTGRPIVGPFGRPGTGLIALDDLRCIGNETNIMDCPNLGWGVHNCVHSEDVAVRCTMAS